MSVIDASVWVSRLVRQDQNHTASEAWLTHHVGQGGLLISPTILLAEVAGAVSRRIGRPILGQRAVQTIMAIPNVRLVDIDAALSLEAAQIAATVGLKGADAVYVALARQLGLPLTTWDNEQLTRPSHLITVHTP